MRPKQIEELVKIVERSAIDELEISRWWGQKIRIHKNRGGVAGTGVTPAPVQYAAPPPLPVLEPVMAAEPKAAPADSGKFVPIRAPMVGTFYRASSPDASPYVKEGDVIAKGQVVCIIEAMKLMNEIESEVGGRVVKVLVENAQPIEYNQSLFLIDPS
ncbi:MAG: acetyl-CoA carboxylase biotin carboxyl carrier protein [Calditrichaeota bacterium]|nr:MAG: acetyl-CoA carboxylase biotin carboxyl carrier protein [Calditrichota bacterium]RPI00837.1 MAG: acetyl-CoA carboxylase biotin carboxyl carrier protein [Calditrichota bacterium]